MAEKATDDALAQAKKAQGQREGEEATGEEEVTEVQAADNRGAEVRLGGRNHGRRGVVCCSATSHLRNSAPDDAA